MVALRRQSNKRKLGMRFNWKIILAAILSLSIGVGTADAGLFHDMEDVGKGVVVDATVHEGEKVVARDAEKKAISSASKSYVKHRFEDRNTYLLKHEIDPMLKDTKGRTNLQRMKEGLAPKGRDGKPVTLHHLIQQEPGPVAEVRQSLHAAGHKILHGIIEDGTSFRRDPALKKGFESFRTRYWKNRAANIRKTQEDNK